MEEVSGETISDRLWNLHAVIAIPSIFAPVGEPMHKVQIERTLIALRRLKSRFEIELGIGALMHSGEIFLAPESGSRVCGDLARKMMRSDFGSTETGTLLRKNSLAGFKAAVGKFVKADTKLLFLIPDDKTPAVGVVDNLFGSAIPRGSSRTLYPGQFLIYYPKARGHEYFTWNNEVL